MSNSKYKILYIDDEIVNLRLFKYSFRRDFDITTVQSGKEALEFLEKQNVEIVITDQRMPEMTGVELLEIINKKYPEIPPKRMIVSGYSPDDVIEKAFKEYKLYSFVSKPWNYEKLKEIITNAIENGES